MSSFIEIRSKLYTIHSKCGLFILWVSYILDVYYNIKKKFQEKGFDFCLLNGRGKNFLDELYLMKNQYVSEPVVGRNIFHGECPLL